MGLLTSRKALRLEPCRKRKRTNHTHKLNKLRIIKSFSSTGSAPATPFNSTTFLMGLQQLREFENSPHQLAFDQYGSMEHLLACWPLDDGLSPGQANFINDGYDTVHEDTLIASSSPTARSGHYYATSEHEIIAGSSCDSMEDGGFVRNTCDFAAANCVYDQECSSTDVLSSGMIPILCSRDNPAEFQYGVTNGGK